jgi:lysyl-tRNA synthetase class 2
MIERALFDEASRELTICFKAGRKYIYSDVPRAVFDALKTAASAGAYFNACIKGRFACRPEARRFRPD